mmetsp:Transcript_51938/g.97152  ORF Transcript_51938/g.97152 Transcript_51938/m.97152 type:complete len:319 (+) Transcript_51938:602-1558(+)
MTSLCRAETRQLPCLPEEGAIERSPIPVLAQESAHVMHLRNARHQLHDPEHAVGQRLPALELVVVSHHPLRGKSARVGAREQVDPVGRRLCKAVRCHEVHEIRNALEAGEVQHLVPGIGVQHYQGSLHGDQTTVHLIEVIRAGDNTWIGRKRNLGRRCLCCGQGEVVELEDPHHLAVVIPSSMTHVKVGVSIRQTHKRRTAPALNEATLPVRIIQHILRTLALAALLEEGRCLGPGCTMFMSLRSVCLDELGQLPTSIHEEHVVQLQLLATKSQGGGVVAIQDTPHLEERVTNLLPVGIRRLERKHMILHVGHGTRIC